MRTSDPYIEFLDLVKSIPDFTSYRIDLSPPNTADEALACLPPHHLLRQSPRRFLDIYLGTNPLPRDAIAAYAKWGEEAAGRLMMLASNMTVPEGFEGAKKAADAQARALYDHFLSARVKLEALSLGLDREASERMMIGAAVVLEEGTDLLGVLKVAASQPPSSAGTVSSWRVFQNYLVDVTKLFFKRADDGCQAVAKFGFIPVTAVVAMAVGGLILFEHILKNGNSLTA